MKTLPLFILLGSMILTSFNSQAEDEEYLKLVPEAKNTIVSELSSPDGKHVAYIFERNAGATTSFSTQISVLSPSESAPTDGGNVFIADAGSGSVLRGSWGGPLALAHWTAHNELIIAYATGSRIFKKADRIATVRLVYKTIEAEQDAAANP